MSLYLIQVTLGWIKLTDSSIKPLSGHNEGVLLWQNQISVLTIIKELTIIMAVTQSLGPLKTWEAPLKLIWLQAAEGTLDQLWMVSIGIGWHKRQLSQVPGV